MTNKKALELLVNSHLGDNYSQKEVDKNYLEIVDKLTRDLEDFEWLKSKLNLIFLDSLSSPEDKERLLEIMGG